MEMQRRNMSARDVGQRLGISADTVNGFIYERRRTHRFVVERICRELGLDPDSGTKTQQAAS